MTKYTRSLLLGLSTAALLSSGCAKPFPSIRVSGPTVSPSPEPATDAVYYALPRTELVVGAKLKAISVDVPRCVELTKALQSHQPKTAFDRANGEDWDVENFALWKAYSDAELDPNELPTKKTVKTGQSDFRVESAARPDADQIFAIELKGKAGHDRKLALSLAVEGLITSGESNATNRSGEIAAAVVVDVLSAVATIVGSVYGSPASKSDEDPATAAVDKRGNITPALQQRPEFDSCYQALERLRQLRQARDRVIDGSGGRQPFDIADQLKILDDERGKLRRLFSGEKKILVGEVRCVLDPSDKSFSSAEQAIETFLLWTYDKQAGIRIDNPNCVVPPEFEASAVAAGAHAVTLELSTEDSINAHARTVHASHTVSEDTEAALYYRVPGRASISLLEADKIRLGPDAMTIAQYGPVLPLIIPRGNKKVEISFSVDPKTGALTKLGVATGGDKAAIPDIGKLAETAGSLTKVTKAELDARKPKDPTKSEIAKELLVDNCIAAIEAGEWSAACETL